MVWKKQGVIFSPESNFSWMHSHAMLPTPLVQADHIRIYYCTRGDDKKSRIGFVDVNKTNPSEIISISSEPVLNPGRLGTFDDSGVLPGSVLEVDGVVYLYYVGYNIRHTVPYSNSIGLAISNDGGKSFERKFEGPLVDRNHLEPYFAVSPCVIKQKEKWHMWYASGTGWIEVNGKPESLYHIKYAESENGVDWKRDNLSCIAPLDKHEANARPTVLCDGAGFKMWYSYRGSFDFRDGEDSYRIGYAESEDGKHWERKDSEVAELLETQEWDSTMQAYPNVLRVGEELYLFYNGNGFGQTGFGYAKWEG